MDSRSTKPSRDIIVIGGSHGSLDALRDMLLSLPINFPAAILIVLHTGPSSPMMMAAILSRYTAMPLAYAIEGEPVRQGRIYLAPPDKHLEVRAPGTVHLSNGRKVNFARPAVDRLFETAASTFGTRVIGLVLSGGDSDGADGSRAIAKAGGITFVQDPDEAMIPSMALETIQIDHPVARLKSDVLGEVLRRIVCGK